MKWFGKSCSREQISLLVAGGLTGAEKVEAEHHATICPKCGKLLAEITASVSEIKQAKHRRADVEPSRKFRHRWVQAVQEVNTRTPLQTTRSRIRLPLLGGEGRGEGEQQNTLKNFFARGWGLLSQIILPRPGAWASLGAVWALIFYFHVSCPKTAVKVASATPINQSVANYAEQRRELARVLEFSSLDFGSEKVPNPKPTQPVTAPTTRPRTQRQTPTMLG